jgi:hypothetical protein
MAGQSGMKDAEEEWDVRTVDRPNRADSRLHLGHRQFLSFPFVSSQLVQKRPGMPALLPDHQRP